MTKNTIEKIITHNRRGFAVHQIWAMFDELERKHAETLRLLGEAFRWVDDYNCRMSGSGVLVEEIRAHLASMKGSQ